MRQLAAAFVIGRAFKEGASKLAHSKAAAPGKRKSMNIPHILSIVTYLPVLAALVILLIPGKSEKAIKLLAFVGSLIAFIVSLHLVYHFDATRGHMQFEESVQWIRASTFQMNHYLGIDGISLFLVIL